MNLENGHYSLNERNERIEVIGDIALNLDYWDCECEHNYIHPIKKQVCNVCNFIQEDCPSNRENEMRQYIRGFDM